MGISQIIGSLGVTLLLLVYFLHIFGYLKSESRLFLASNVVGAGLSCFASVLINYIPFVILEATWTAVSFIALVRLVRNELKTKAITLSISTNPDESTENQTNKPVFQN